MKFFDRFRRKKDKERLEELGDRSRKPLEKKTEEKEKKSVEIPKRLGSGSSSVLLHPLQTEKATKLLERNQYVFAVSRSSNKRQIRQAIRDLYGIDPVSVAVQNQEGKAVRYGRTTGRTSSRKKAIVSLKQGDSITLTESK